MLKSTIVYLVLTITFVAAVAVLPISRKVIRAGEQPSYPQSYYEPVILPVADQGGQARNVGDAETGLVENVEQAIRAVTNTARDLGDNGQVMTRVGTLMPQRYVGDMVPLRAVDGSRPEITAWASDDALVGVFTPAGYANFQHAYNNQQRPFSRHLAAPIMGWEELKGGEISEVSLLGYFNEPVVAVIIVNQGGTTFEAMISTKYQID